MGRSRSVAVDRDGLMTLEYVRSRQVLRLVGTADDKAELRELALPALFHELGLDPGELAPPRQFLLFAGSGGRPLGGLADLVAVYQDETAARDAFRRARLAEGNGAGWAELAAVGNGGRVEAVCWFGRPRSVGRTTARSHVVDGMRPKGGRRTWRFRRRPTSVPA